jgi:putative transposon-encoded protein
VRDEERVGAAAAAVVVDENGVDFSKVAFSEDWQMSQFWYDDATAEALARECWRAVGCDGVGNIACVSCPTLYIALKKLFGDKCKGKGTYTRTIPFAISCAVCCPKRYLFGISVVWKKGYLSSLHANRT